MFDGRDYNRQFEEACDELSTAQLSREQVRRQLSALEWVLWEAVRGVAIVMSAVLSCSIVIVLACLIGRQTEFASGIVETLALVTLFFLFVIMFYGLFRFVFYFEISRHVIKRKFGTLCWPLAHPSSSR